MQAESLHTEKRALDKQLEYCQQEIADSERRLKAAQVSRYAKTPLNKISVFSSQNSLTDRDCDGPCWAEHQA